MLDKQGDIDDKLEMLNLCATTQHFVMEIMKKWESKSIFTSFD